MVDGVRCRGDGLEVEDRTMAIEDSNDSTSRDDGGYGGRWRIDGFIVRAAFCS